MTCLLLLKEFIYTLYLFVYIYCYIHTHIFTDRIDVYRYGYKEWLIVFDTDENLRDFLGRNMGCSDFFWSQTEFKTLI